MGQGINYRPGWQAGDLDRSLLAVLLVCSVRAAYLFPIQLCDETVLRMAWLLFSWFFGISSKQRSLLYFHQGVGPVKWALGGLAAPCIEARSTRYISGPCPATMERSSEQSISL